MKSLIASPLLVLALAGCGDTAVSTPAPPDHAAPTSTAPSAAPTVLLDVTGTGTKSTQKFSTAGDWDLEWSYDCPSETGNFIVHAIDGTGDLHGLVNELGAKGSDVTHQHTAGTYYLEVVSGCPWHVVVKG